MILKPIDISYTCSAPGTDLDGILANIFAFNNIVFVQTDQAGAQINPDPYAFFAINRVLAIRPIARNTVNKYSSASYECLLTIARPINADLEVETVNVDGQFETITRQFLSLDFANALRAYFMCCDYKVSIVQIRPIWNSTAAAKRVNHSGVEINLTIEI